MNFDFDDLNDFLGKPDEQLGENGEEQEELQYEPVENFDFINADPLDDQLLQFHQPQFNWLLRELKGLTSLDGRDFDKIEKRNGELQNTILELVRAAKNSEREGNQWRSEYETQAEYNDKLGQDIFKMTDNIEYIKGLLSNSDNLYQEFDGYSEMKWKKLIRKLDKDLKEKEALLRDFEQRFEEEVKIFLKRNQERTKLLNDLSALSPEETKALENISKEKEALMVELEREKENPSPRKSILDDFKNRKENLQKRKEQPVDSRTTTAVGGGTRSGGRYKGKATPRGGTMHLASGVAKSEREIRQLEEDEFLRRGVHGSKINVDRRGPDPVAALFNQGRNLRPPVSSMNQGAPGGPEDDYSEFLTTPRTMKGYNDKKTSLPKI